MKRTLTLIVLPLFFGLCGAMLRAVELAYSFDPLSGLHTTQLAVTPALVALCAIVSLLFLVFAWFIQPDQATVSTPRPVFYAASGLAALVLFGLAAYQIAGCVTNFVLTTFIHALLTLYCAVSLLALGKTGLAQRPSSAYTVFAVVPVFWACFTLILVYRERIADPILLDYIYLIVAFIFILLFLYALTGYVYGKNKFRLAAVTGPLALFFLTINVVAQPLAAFLPQTRATFEVIPLEFGALIAFLILIPFSLYEIFRNANQIH